MQKRLNIRILHFCDHICKICTYVYVGGFNCSNRYMHTGVVGSMKTDEVLKEALDYSSDCLHNYNNCSSNFLLQRYSD